MAGLFSLTKMSSLDIDDPFFDNLKADYPGTPFSTGFTEWFHRVASQGRSALVFNDEQGIGAFVCIKEESEPIPLQEKNLPVCTRVKISTLCIAERYRGQRLGEGAIGLTLWKWQALGADEIYVTVFSKQQQLIGQLEKFGFILAGHNLDGECVYLRSRYHVDYSDPYRAFPFVNPDFRKAGYLIVNDNFHDTLFPYSELKNSRGPRVILDVSNGISKTYIGSPISKPHYNPGEPVFIYRKSTQPCPKRYNSCLTTYCIVKEVVHVKSAGQALMPYEDYLSRIGNKSIYQPLELQTKYYNEKTLVIIELVYYGYFGEGNNVTMDWLDRNGCWGTGYPTETQLSPEQFRKILREGNVDVDNVIID